jgi:pimeloyl-ACP methyl ester carboxylesterase
MAAAQEIEADPTHGIGLTAIAAGVGGYDLTSMLQGIATSTYYSYPSYLGFILKAYNTTNGWEKPMSYFFQQQYADSLNKYMDGSRSGSFINSKLSSDVTKLFNPDFFSALKMEGGEQELKNTLLDNSIKPWKTTVPIRLYHGSKDDIVPYQNSESIAKKFQDAGSTDVSFKLIQGGTHGSTFIRMLEDMVPWLIEMKSTQ